MCDVACVYARCMCMFTGEEKKKSACESESDSVCLVVSASL